MPWVRFDDQFTIHRKVKGLSDAAYRLHTEAIFWCARNLTDGFVPAEDVADVATARRPSKSIPELVARGVWGEVDGGWQIHDYLEFQPSKAKVERERQQKAERQARWKANKGKKIDASVDTSRAAAPTRPGPLPSGERVGGTKRLRPVDNWCGECSETRHIELDTGAIARCPRCHPERSTA